MDPLKKKQARFKELIDRIKELDAKTELTDEETTELEKLTAEGKTLKSEIETLEASANERKGLIEFASAKTERLPIGGKKSVDADDDDNPSGVTFEKERAGTELVRKTERGLIAVGAEGWGISEKQFRAISEPSYKAAFMSYIRLGRDGMSDVDKKAMAEGIDTQGGYLVPPDILARIIARKPHPTSILGAISTLTTSRDRIQLPKFKYNTDDIYASGIRIAWVGEQGTASEDTSLENWGEKEIAIHTGMFEIQMGENLLEDSAFDVEGFMVRMAQQSYALGLDYHVVQGNGVNKPTGLLTNAAAADGIPTVNIGNPVTHTGLLDLVNTFPPQYEENAKVLMNKTNVYAALSKIEDGAGNLIFGLMQNIDGGLANARIPVLLGHPILFSAFMPNSGAANKVAVYGDFAECYALIQRVGFSIKETTDRTMANANKRSWRFRFRVGGDVWQDRAAQIGVQS